MDRWRRRRGALQTTLKDRLDVLAMRHALTSNAKHALTRRIHTLVAVLLGAAQDTEDGPVTHLGLRVPR
jgi:hypothetical protein